MNLSLANRCFLFFLLTLWPVPGLSSNEGVSELAEALQTLDRFMVAGREGDPQRGATLLDMYETSPRKAEREIGAYFERKRDVFRHYVSISNDIYGYEFEEKGFGGPNLELEGGVETSLASKAEFSARLVFRDLRWRILSFEID